MSKIKRLVLEKDKSITDTYNELLQTAKNNGCELVLERLIEGINNQVLLAVFEKFYLRSNSYASLTLLLAKENQITTLDIVGAAGGTGIFNISYWANSDITVSIEQAAKSLGFQTKNKVAVE